VTLRRWRVEDAPDIARACDDPVTARWLPVPSPYTLEDGIGYVEQFTAPGWADGRTADVAVTDAETGEVLGAVGIKLPMRSQGVGEVGYWTAPWARDRGVASRAARLIAGWGLSELGLSRVELLAEVGNDASQRVAEKAGFVREGVLRAARRDREGTPRDFVCFSRTAADGAGRRSGRP
jgi:RimJ/RimL family protein N-acetyltransferase